MTGTQYRCVATNSAGSATSAVVTLTVLADVIAPTQPAAPQVAGNGGSTPMLSGSTEANATITVYNNGVLVGTTVASGSGAWSYTLSLSSGSHTITVTATDAAGNVSTSSVGITVTIGTSSAASVSSAVSSGGGGGGCGAGSSLALLCAVLACSLTVRGRHSLLDK